MTSTHPDAKATIGFVGLGAMGFGIATHLARLGHPICGYDLSSETLTRFTSASALCSAAPSLAVSAQGSTHYVVMVATATQAQSALFGARPASPGLVTSLPQGAVLYLCATVPASYVEDVAAELARVGRRDVLFIDCPVSGGAKRAAEGKLSVMVGGEEKAISGGRQILRAMAQEGRIFVAGGIGAGSRLKMVHQVLAGIQILVVAEAMGLAGCLRLEPGMVRQAVLKSGGWSWMFENRSERMVDEDYFPGVSALSIILKDMGIITSTARETSFPVPLSSTAEQVYISAVKMGFEKDDDSSVVRMYYSEALSKAPSTLETPLTEGETNRRIELIIKLLKGVHVCSAAEAIAFTKHLGLDLEQFYQLTKDAAGGSSEFQGSGWEMIKLLKGQSSEDDGASSSVAEMVLGLKEVADEARKLECPLYMGTQALNMCLMAVGIDPEARVSGLPRIWVSSHSR